MKATAGKKKKVAAVIRRKPFDKVRGIDEDKDRRRAQNGDDQLPGGKPEIPSSKKHDKSMGW